MVNIAAYRRIYELIARQISFGLNPAEEEELECWLKESEENRLLHSRLTDPHYLIRQEEKRNSVDVEKHWRIVRNRLTESKGDKGLSGRYWKYAAIIMLLLGGGVLGWFMQREENVPVDVTQQIHPGISKARLVLADGKTVELEKRNGDTQLIECDGMLISNDSCGLKYNGQIEMPVADWHTLEVSKGGEYIMTLQDGTVVWLNSETKMRYPVQFSGQNREVWLEGEAYFKVAKNEKQPFVVKTENMDVRVLGTEFNLSAYSDQEKITTTLEEGSLKILPDDPSVAPCILSPNEQLVYIPSRGKVDVRQVVGSDYSAWKEGGLLFNNDSFEDILKTLERVYNVKVHLRTSAYHSNRLTIHFNKNESLVNIMMLLKEIVPGLEYQIKEDGVYID